ncbi:MAG: type II toxin-antitoxin system Phd/YefM family antitoxin [Patescibacteria group bacterium]
MKKTSVYLLRDNLASYLDEVIKTEVPLVVYKYKKPIAVIMPPKKELIEDDIDEFFGFLPGNETGVEFVNRVRRNKKEREYVKKLRKGIT